MRAYRVRLALISSTALISAIATAASAQTGESAPAGGAPPAAVANASATMPTDELVVTATKQSTTISRVPISVTALTQKTLDQASIRSFGDIVRSVPALSLQSDAIADRIPNISIRGVASSSGAPTTGIYLDDTPLQKRNAIGISGSGTPIPQLFDLERIEVLRGPQGTLYGGSSLGGTIRFITPTPSLDHYSVYSRAEVGAIQNGGISHEIGVAVGGPIVEDKLGFRFSIDERHFGGYVDHVDRFTGETLAKNTNTQDDRTVRAVVLFQPTDQLSITPALYYSYSHQADTDTVWRTVPATTLDGYNYPAAVFGDYQTGLNCNIGDDYAGTVKPCATKQPRTQELFIPSVKVAYDLGFATLTSISSYIHDRTHGTADYSYVEPSNFQGGFPFVHNVESYTSTPNYENKRHGFTEEFRFSSNDADAKLSWVLGGFYSRYYNNSNYHIVANLGDLTQAVFGGPPQAIFGVPVEDGNITYHRDQDLTEESIAAFGEVNYRITPKLKAILGGRVSGEKFSYHQVTAGVFAGFLTPTTANGGLTDGTVKETPVTPRFGLQYQANPYTMVYATASKGFRVGGVNQPPPAARCGADLASLGITSTPGTYKADHLWSYELGVKTRTSDNRGSMNASAFYIDWSDIQTSFGLPTCGFGYVINGAKAVSKGFDLQGSYRLGGLTLSGQFAYTDAKYTSAVVGPEPRNTVYINDGDRLPVPRYAFNLGAEYAVPVGSYAAFVRADYQHASDYQRSASPGTNSYTPETWQAEATDFVTARAGLGRDGWEASVFVDNLLNSKDELSAYGGRTGCAAATGAACTTYSNYVQPYQYTTFRPRTIGLTVTVRR